MEAIWQAVKEVIKNQLPEATFDLWIEPLQAESGPGGELVLSCPNPFALRWVQAHYLKLIGQILETALNCNLAVHLKLLTAPVRPPVPVRQASLPLVAEKTRRPAFQPGLYL